MAYILNHTWFLETDHEVERFFIMHPEMLNLHSNNFIFDGMRFAFCMNDDIFSSSIRPSGKTGLPLKIDEDFLRLLLDENVGKRFEQHLVKFLTGTYMIAFKNFMHGATLGNETETKIYNKSVKKWMELYDIFDVEIETLLRRFKRYREGFNGLKSEDENKEVKSMSK